MNLSKLLRAANAPVIRIPQRIVFDADPGLAARQRLAREQLGVLAIDAGSTLPMRRECMRPGRNVTAMPQQREYEHEDYYE